MQINCSYKREDESIASRQCRGIVIKMLLINSGFTPASWIVAAQFIWALLQQHHQHLQEKGSGNLAAATDPKWPVNQLFSPSAHFQVSSQHVRAVTRIWCDLWNTQIYISVTFCNSWSWGSRKWMLNVLSPSKLATTVTWQLTTVWSHHEDPQSYSPCNPHPPGHSRLWLEES